MRYTIHFFSKLFFLLVFSVLLCSCKKEPAKPNPSPIVNDLSKGIYVLNEGLFNMNNASLTYFSYIDSIARTDFFDLKNGRKLGDVGNDIALYGNKLYIIVSVSSQLEVVNPYTGKSIKQISFFDGNKPRQPRYMAFQDDKVFVCSFDGTVAVIDTATLTIQKYITVGRNPDGIAVANNKIYVSNSGGLDFPNYDNTVSVIDIHSLTEIKRIQIGLNPYTIMSDEQGNVYVISRGNYLDIPMRFHVIDSQIDELAHTFDNLEVLGFAIDGHEAYVYHINMMSGENSRISVLDLNTRQVITENFITDGTTIETVHAIHANTSTNEVFISDARGYTGNGKVYCFTKEGKLLYSFETGITPGNMVFLK